MVPGGDAARPMLALRRANLASVRAGAWVLSLAVHGAALAALVLMTPEARRSERRDVVPVRLVYEIDAQSGSGAALRDVSAPSAASPAPAPAPERPRLGHRTPRSARIRRETTPPAATLAPAPETTASDVARDPAIDSPSLTGATREATGHPSSDTTDHAAPGAVSAGPSGSTEGPSGAEVASRGAGDGPSGATDAIAAYLRVVRARLGARLVFPALARELGLRGTVTVRFVIEADGSVDPDSIVVEASSGSPLLDRAAVETVERAAPFPAPLDGRCSIRSPVVFTLRP